MHHFQPASSIGVFFPIDSSYIYILLFNIIVNCLYFLRLLGSTNRLNKVYVRDFIFTWEYNFILDQQLERKLKPPIVNHLWSVCLVVG